MLQEDNNVINFGTYVTARLKLLGIQDIQRHLNNARCWNEAEMEQITGKVSNLYRSIYGMQYSFMNAYHTLSKGNIGNIGLTDAQQECLHRMQKCRVGFLHRPDHVLVYAPVGMGRNAISTLTIYLIICATTIMFLKCLEDQNFLQGWLDFDFGLKTDKKFNGPEILQLWKNERTVACSPNIYIGRGLYYYLKKKKTIADVADFSAVVNQRFAALCFELLSFNDKRVPYIDYDGDKFREIVMNWFSL